jgi:hypothetical protein
MAVINNTRKRVFTPITHPAKSKQNTRTPLFSDDKSILLNDSENKLWQAVIITNWILGEAKSPSANKPGKHPPYQGDNNHGYKYVNEYSNHVADPLSTLNCLAYILTSIIHPAEAK